MQMTLKSKFVTWMIGYREKQTWNRPAGLQVFKKRLQHRCFPVEYVKLSRTVMVASEGS